MTVREVWRYGLTYVVFVSVLFNTELALEALEYKVVDGSVVFVILERLSVSVDVLETSTPFDGADLGCVNFGSTERAVELTSFLWLGSSFFTVFEPADCWILLEV